eukprot:Colp12_sorted_trinity150504_noHs@35956
MSADQQAAQQEAKQVFNEIAEKYKAQQNVDVETLKAKEAHVTSSVLLAGAHYIGKNCKEVNDAFMLCRYNSDGDPTKCLQEGVKVTQCSLEILKRLKSACNTEFTKHWTCLDENNQSFEYCRGTQKKFDSCVFEKTGLEKAKSV